MASVRLEKIDKTYPPNVHALKGVDVGVESGELFTLLGPSGCGKTTLLRIVAGFVSQDSGRVLIGDKRMDHVPAYRRDIGMVFQDYAIFPHMSVANNVAFGLRNRKVSGPDIKARVEDALAMARLSGYGERMPAQLSGGQQQRVGLARAIVIRPQVLLMDEPLSNLDAKLRVELRDDIRDMQRALGITSIYVTHDQEEALVISDRICVMNDGRVEQIGTPWDIYKTPRSRFVAAFVGTMNFLDVKIDGLSGGPGGGGPSGGAAAVTLGEQRMTGRLGAPSGAEARMAVRPEDVIILHDGAPAPERAFRLDGAVTKISYTGSQAHCVVACPRIGAVLTVYVDRPTPALLGAGDHPLALALPHDRMILFDAKTERSLAWRCDA